MSQWRTLSFFAPSFLKDSPYINRFLQPDTLIPDPTSPQAFNRYSYVGNNPIGFNDPTGHARSCEDGDVCMHDYDSTPTDDGNKGDDDGWEITVAPPPGLTFNLSTSTPTVDDYIWSLMSPFVLPACNDYLYGACNSTLPLPNFPVFSGSPAPSLVEIYCGVGVSDIACLGAVLQDAAVIVDLIGVLAIELPAVSVGCAAGGPAGCVAGEFVAWAAWEASPLNGVETGLSGASLYLTYMDEGFVGENTVTSGATFWAGLVQPPSGDFVIDFYSSGYSHGIFNSVTDIMSGGSVFK